MDEVSSSGPEFFDIRYAAGKMPWDFGGVPESLNMFLDRHCGPGRVLIPGCGSGYEIEAFFGKGWEVIGIDFSRLAVARARSLLGPLAGKVYEGDFFACPSIEGCFDIIYERTFSLRAFAGFTASLCPADCRTDCPVGCPLRVFLFWSRRRTSALPNLAVPT